VHPESTSSLRAPFKCCTKCGCAYSATTEFFFRDRGKRDGLFVWCKACASARQSQRKAERTDDQRAHDRNLNRAWIAANPGYYSESCARNKDKRAVQKHAVYVADLDASRAKSRSNHAKHRDRELQKQGEWRDKNRDYVNDYARSYGRAHLEQAAAHQRLRRARKASAPGTHTAEDVAAQLDRQNGRCYWCGMKTADKYHADHVIPLAKGGSNGPENIVIACPTCNLKKHDKHPMDFAGVML
jgi:5-methylcytosine-specific restriction endonuclease McrA